jgi:hypothetical protein
VVRDADARLNSCNTKGLADAFPKVQDRPRMHVAPRLGIHRSDGDTADLPGLDAPLVVEEVDRCVT